MSTQQDILEKIEKLLALGGSDNVHEAELALKRAQELSIKYNIDLSRVSGASEKPEYVRDSVDSGQRLKITQKWVTPILMKYFDVRLVYSGGRRGGKSIWFVGRKEKVDRARELNDYLNNTFLNLWNRYQMRTGTKVDSRNSYMEGLFKGFSEVLEENRKKVLEESLDADGRNRYSIVMADESQAIKRAQDGFWDNLRTVKVSYSMNGDGNAYNTGMRDGRNIRLNSGLLH